MYILQLSNYLYYAGISGDGVKFISDHTKAFRFEKIGDAMKVASELNSQYNKNIQIKRL